MSRVGIEGGAPFLLGLGESRSRLERVRRDLQPRSTVQRGGPARRVAVMGLGGVGGSGKVAAETAEGLARLEHEVLYISSPEPVFDPRVVQRVAAPVPRTPRAATDAWVDQLSTQLAETLHEARTEVLFVHYVTGTLEAALRARDRAGIGTRVAAVLHGSDITRWGDAPGQAERIRVALEVADEVVAVSPWLAEQARELLSLSRTPTVIDNAIDVDRFRPGNWSAQVRGRFAPSGALLLGHVSNLRGVKRATDAVEALAALGAMGTDARLLVVGEGPQLEHVQARARATDVAGRVVFTGAVSPVALPELIAACDMTLVTSSSESFSLVAMESLASGVPVAATRCGGLELALNRLVPVGAIAPTAVGAPAEMAAGIRNLWQARERYQAVQQAGLRLAVEDFPRPRQLAGYARLVQELAGRR